MRRLELAQLLDQRVELGVGNLGCVEDEVLLVVVLDQLAQLLRTLGVLLRRHAAQSTDRVRLSNRTQPVGER